MSTHGNPSARPMARALPSLLAAAFLAAGTACSSSSSGETAAPTAPDTSFTAAPASTSRAYARFDVEATKPGATFRCALDGAAEAACEWPFDLGTLAPGEHTFSVRAVGPTGLEDPTPATTTWTVAPWSETGWSQVSVGQSVGNYDDHETAACAVTTDGRVYCWGRSTMGGFGPAGGTSHLDPALVGTGYAAVSTSAWYTCAIRAAPRTLRCWGWNPWSFLAPVDTAEDWASVTTGVSSACGVTSGGALLCWGDGESGQLGDGTTTSRVDPAPVATVASGTRWTAVAVGRDHACGIRDDASLWCWGLNQGGSLGDGTSVQRNEPVSPGGTWTAVACGVGTTCGVRTDGTLHCWGGGETPGIPGEPSPTAVGTEDGWVGVTIGGAHVCAWKSDGTATCWGENGSGEHGSGQARSDATSSSPAVAVASISAAGHSTCAVTPEGRLHCWGSNADGVAGIGTVGNKRNPVHVLPGRTFTSLSAGYYGTCAVSGGRRFCTGYNGTGRLGDGTRTSREILGATDAHDDWRSVQLSSSFGCGFRSGDALECWGTGSAIGAAHLAPAPVGPAGAWNELALGGDGICGTTPAGALECWGDNSRGALGDGTITARDVPTQVAGGGTWSSVSAFADHACATRSNGQLACWGGNDTAELGTGDAVDHLQPTGVGTEAGWSRVATGQSHTCGIRDGIIHCWGSGRHGAAGYDGVRHGRNVPAPVLSWDLVLREYTHTAASEIATGAFHSCAISAGELRCWGSGVVPHVVWVEPPGVFEKMVAKRIGTASDWTAVSLGRKHTCGLRNGGQLWCWGENGNGELGDGQGFYATPMLVPLPAP